MITRRRIFVIEVLPVSGGGRLILKEVVYERLSHNMQS